MSAQAVAFEFDAMGIVDDAVENGVGAGGFTDQVVPAVDRDLAGDDGGTSAVTLLDDLEKVAALLGAEGLEAPIVENEELDPAEGASGEVAPGELGRSIHRGTLNRCL